MTFEDWLAENYDYDGGSLTEQYSAEELEVLFVEYEEEGW